MVVTRPVVARERIPGHGAPPTRGARAAGAGRLGATTTELAEYRQIMIDAALPLETTADERAAFRGSLDAWQVEDVTIMRVHSVAQTVRRTPRSCRREPSDLVKVLVQRSGSAGAEQQGRRLLLGPRALTLYDTALPYEVVQRTTFTADALLVPRDRLPVGPAATPILQERPLLTDRGLGALFVSYLDELRGRLWECSPEGAGRCTAILLDLLQATVTEAATTAMSGPALRVCVLDWIDRHLDDEQLAPAVIAAANGISVRYLHRLFADSGVTVSGYVRSRRLGRIRADLVDPTHRHRTIAAIGSRWGISDPAHLSRLFRAEFAQTPGEVRRRAASPGEACSEMQEAVHAGPTAS